MAAGALTTTTHDTQIRQVWSDLIISEFMRDLIFWPLITDLSGQLAGGGDVVYLPLIRNYAQSDIQTHSDTAAAQYAAQTVSDGVNTLTVNTPRYASIEITTPLELLSQYDYAKLYTPKLSHALARLIDAAISTLLAASSSHSDISVGDVSIDTSVTDAQTLASFAKAKSNFDKYDVPEDERFWVVDPVTYARLLRISQLSSGDYGPIGAIGQARLPYLFNSPVFKSNSIKSATVSGTTTYDCLYFHRSAVAGALKGVNVMLEPKNARFQHTQVTAELMYGLANMPNDGTNQYAIQKLTTTDDN